MSLQEIIEELRQIADDAGLYDLNEAIFKLEKYEKELSNPSKEGENDVGPITEYGTGRRTEEEKKIFEDLH